MSSSSEANSNRRQEILHAALCCDDGLKLAQLARRWERLVTGDKGITSPTLRIAILSDGSAETYIPQLHLMCAARGHDFLPMIGTFGGISQDILDPSSKLYQFKPDIVFIHPLPTSVTPPPLPVMDVQGAMVRASAESDRLLKLCSTLRERAACEVILANFEPPWDDPMAGLPPSMVSTRTYLELVNRELSMRAPPFVHIMDVTTLVSWFGHDRWHNGCLWHHAKQPMCHDAMVLFAGKFAGMVACIRGTSSKCLVLDLDNTLWGGVVGDDGIDGIRLGEGSGEGEAYKAFQTYLKGLKERGVLLAVCSKNEELTARLPFTSHPETVLKLDDFCCFVANWDPKADNCLNIAGRLNLLPDALVFVDDDPVERAVVRQFAPQVRVLEMPQDPSLFPKTIERAFLFETNRLTAEDIQRTAYYHVEMERRNLETQATDLTTFLKSLDMTATVGPYHTRDVPRISQLFNKSNQFNLCTRRYSEQEIQSLLGDKTVLSVQIRLQDRFGGHGLISMAHLHPVDKKILRLDNWVMSCRVLKRGVEQMMCNRIADEANKRGFEKVEFDYLPTPKNGLVKDLYQRLGFEKLCDLADGGQRWTLLVSSFQPFQIPIVVKT